MENDALFYEKLCELLFQEVITEGSPPNARQWVWKADTEEEFNRKIKRGYVPKTYTLQFKREPEEASDGE